MKIARQGGVFVRDLDRRNRRIVEFGAALVAIDGQSVGARDPRVLRIAVEKEFRVSVGTGGAKIAVARADAMSAGKLIGGLPGGPVGRLVPGVIPTVIAAGHDARGGGENLAELRPAIFGGAERAHGLEPKLHVVREERR